MDQKEAFRIVKDFVKFLRGKGYNVQKAYIFGSYAKGIHNEDSDIDLAIILKSLQNGYLMQIDLMKLSRKFDSRIEPHPFDEEDFRHLSYPLVREIMKTGMPVI